MGAVLSAARRRVSIVALGAVVRCRSVGLLGMTDESGEDAKVLGVPMRRPSGK